MRSHALKSTVEMLVPLTAGFLLSAVLVTGALSAVGEAVAIPEAWSGPIAAMGLVALAAIEPTHVRRSVLLRQTPRLLPSKLGAAPGALAWGLDTGSMVSTYRTSVATWALLGLCLLGFGGAWVGCAYTLGFCAPLVLAVLRADRGRLPKATSELTMRVNAQRARMNIVVVPVLALCAVAVVP